MWGGCGTRPRDGRDDWTLVRPVSCPTSRSAAYNLLCALTCTFNLKIEGQLLETSGLCIPANNTLFIVSISKTLAANEPHLTLEFLEECISGFSKSSESSSSSDHAQSVCDLHDFY